MVIYSHSRLESFEQCRLKFKFRYIDKIIPEIGQSIEAHLGSMVHETLEWLYAQIKKDLTPPAIEQVISYYAEKWQEKFTHDIIIVKKEFTEKDYFNKGVGFLVKYYTRHYPFEEKTLELEHKIELNLTDEIKLIGFIDRLVENSDGEIEIHDYKTSNTMPSRKKIESNRQLGIYSLAIKETFGKDKNICLVWHYLAHDIKVCIRKTEQQLKDLKQEIIALVNKIEEAKDFPPNKSILCDWCQYRDICTAWGGVPKHRERQATFNNSQKTLDIWD